MSELTNLKIQKRYQKNLQDIIGKISKGLHDDIRRDIFFEICHSKLTFTELKMKKDFSSGKLNHHLKILKENDLVTNYYDKSDHSGYSYYAPAIHVVRFLGLLQETMYPGIDKKLDLAIESLVEEAENIQRKDSK